MDSIGTDYEIARIDGSIFSYHTSSMVERLDFNHFLVDKDIRLGRVPLMEDFQDPLPV
jgi:hypothetical protein